MNDCPEPRIYARNLMDNTWQVLSEYYTSQIGSGMCEQLEDVLFQGSLSDCEAFIRLREKGQI